MYSVLRCSSLLLSKLSGKVAGKWDLQLIFNFISLVQGEQRQIHTPSGGVISPGSEGMLTPLIRDTSEDTLSSVGWCCPSGEASRSLGPVPKAGLAPDTMCKFQGFLELNNALQMLPELTEGLLLMVTFITGRGDKLTLAKGRGVLSRKCGKPGASAVLFGIKTVCFASVSE